MPPPRPSFEPPRRFRRRYLVMLLPLAIMAFFALRSSPFMGELPWLPEWFAAWADRSWVLRSFVGFLAFGLLWLATVSRSAFHVVALSIFAAAIEVAQIWIPRRVFDWRDIVASVLGIVAAWVLVLGVARATRRTKERC